MISRLRTEIVLVVSGIIAIGCVGPIKYEMTTDFPAAVLQVAGAPPVVDGRTRFRGIFCQLLAASPEFKEDEGACDTFLMRLSDEPEQEQRVRRGDVIGRVGSTGRSTGPHVHYEVFRDGRRVNPWKYLGQRGR